MGILIDSGLRNDIKNIQSNFNLIGAKLRELSLYDYPERDFTTWIPFFGYDDEEERLAVRIVVDDRNSINHAYFPLEFCARLMLENVLRDYNLAIIKVDEGNNIITYYLTRR